MAKIKKAQTGKILGVDNWIQKAACHRGVCGVGSVSDKRAARMDRREAKRNARLDRRDERRQARVDRKEEKRWNKMNLKKGGTVKKALFGIGIGKEERQARREDRKLRREVCRGGKCGGRAKGFIGYNKNGGLTKKISNMAKKAQDGKLVKYTTPSGNKVTADTSGLAAGKKRFPIKVERTTGQTQYGTSGRKSIKRTVASSEGKPYQKQSISSIGQRKAKKALAPKSKMGSKLSKKK